MRIARLACLCLLLLSLLALVPSGLVLAQEEEEKEAIELEPTYRKLEEAYPGASFEYEVALKYTGPESGVPREFDLAATAPQGWVVIITPSFGEQKLLSIRLTANESYPDTIKVRVGPPAFVTPEPGEYKITVEASSGSIKGSVDLLSVITASYSLTLAPTSGLLSTSATTGKDNFYSFVITNTGSGTLENIKFSSSKSQGWAVEFSPATIETLSPGSFQTIDVNIKPAAKAIAGDYEVRLTADTLRNMETLKVRVTVQTPTVWGWVGIGIILAVIAGVSFVFMRFSRR